MILLAVRQTIAPLFYIKAITLWIKNYII